MSSMETFIVVVGLAAAIGGSLIFLSCLAHKHAELVKAFNLQMEIEERNHKIEQNKKHKAAFHAEKLSPSPPVVL